MAGPESLITKAQVGGEIGSAFDVKKAFRPDQEKAVEGLTDSFEEVVKAFALPGENLEQSSVRVASLLNSLRVVILQNLKSRQIETALSQGSELAPITFEAVDVPMQVEIRTDSEIPGVKQKILGFQKIMLGYAAALTQAKIARMQEPWISKRELGDYIEKEETYSKEQVYSRMLEPLSKLGIFEVDKRLGFRLRASPDEIFEMIKKRNVPHTLIVTDYDKWIGHTEYKIAVPPHVVETLHILGNHIEGDPEESLDIDAIRRAFKKRKETRSVDAIYDQFRLLKKLGFITPGIISKYKRKHLVGDLISEFIRRDEVPIILKRISSGISFQEEDSQISRPEGQRVSALLSAKEKETDVPIISWVDSGVKVAEKKEDHELLMLIDAILTADLTQQTFLNTEKKSNENLKRIAYSGLFPEGREQDVFMVLDVLGIGPKELVYLESIKEINNEPSLAQLISKLEYPGNTFVEGRSLLSEVKIRLAMLIYDVAVTDEEAERLYFKGLMKDLALTNNKSAEPLSVPEEIGVEPLENEEVIVSSEKKDKKDFKLNEKLLSVIVSHLKKEVKGAISGDDLPSGWMQPVKAMNYHRSLSFKSDRVPYDDLARLHLVKTSKTSKTRDHHPEYSPVGALIAALYMNDTVGEVTKIIARKIHADKLIILSQHTAHLFRERLEELKAGFSELNGNDAKEKDYLMNCLDELKGKKLVCPCKACVG